MDDTGAKKGPATQGLSVMHPIDFFKEQVAKALQNQKIRVNQNTEYYLVDLLSRFMLADNLFVSDSMGAKHEEVLALRLGEALSTEDAEQRRASLRRLGDVSLYTAGFFADSLSRKTVDIDYYIRMGRTAYGNLVGFSSGFDLLLQKVFDELAKGFDKFVDVLGEISEISGTKDPKNILRIYEFWLKTRSERAKRSLKEAGIIPNGTMKPGWQ